MDPLTEGKVDDYGSLQTDHNATAIEVLKLEQDTCAKDVKEDQKDDIKRNAQEIMNKDPEIFEEGKTMEMSFKEKIWRTALADAAYLGVTMNLGMIGPSLLDLEVRAHTTTSQISTVFTWRALLGLTASLSMGSVLDKVNKYFIVALMLFADVIFVAVAPWFTSLVPMLATLSPPEFFNSVIGMGTHLICISIWKTEAGPSLQSLNLMATIGYTLAPLLCKPFISTATTNELESNSTLTYFQTGNRIGNLTSVTFRNKYGFQTEDDSENVPYVVDKLGNTSDFRVQKTELLREDTSHIEYAYLIVAIYDLVIGILLVLLFTNDGCNVKSKEVVDAEEKDPKDSEKKRVKTFEMKICVLFFVFNIFYGGIEVGYAGLLMTFAVKYLGWSKAQGTDVTAVLQGSNAFITAAAVVMAKYVKPNHMLAASITMVTTSMLVLSILVTNFPVTLWFCTAGLGIGYATIMPSSYTWVNDFMTVSGGFSSAYWSGFFTGFMTIPSLSGYLFQKVHPMCMPYVTLGCGIGMLCIFLIISFLVHQNQKETKTNEQKT